MDTQQKLANMIKDLNQAVASGDLSKLNRSFHERIKIVAPDLKVLGEGKRKCIQSYADFIAKAEIEAYTDDVQDVCIYENTAIIFYNFTMTWLVDGKSFNEKGKELYILTKNDNNWLIALRKLVSAEAN